MDEEQATATLIESNEEWRKILIDGHRPMLFMRSVFRHLPSAPRCKVCSNPFGGLGGKAVGLFGFKRSRKNPNVCSACCDNLPPGGAEVDIAVLFADLRGSTTTGASINATAFARLMNRFYGTATEVLLKHDALIDKLIGDEVMALFIPGVAGPRYRQRACDAGMSLLKAIGAEGGREPWLPLGIAVHAGTAYVGNVGAGGVVDFTALGDTINTAARLQSVAAPGELVLSEEAYGSASGLPEGERRTVPIRGKSETMKIRVVRR
ncbi:MAG: adenylate/guanylate cyclase domain-containing protein [Tepidiformaceae bacterium]